MVARLVSERAKPFSGAERDAVYRAIAERRDVRRGFLPEPLADDVLERLLRAAYLAPSVGFMQPTRIIVVREAAVRAAVHQAFTRANAAAGKLYEADRQKLYGGLKLEGLLEAPLHLCLACEAESARGHGLGRQTMPETALYSTVCAVQNLWLAARAEGVGVGWVSIVEPTALREILAIPEHIMPVAYLCVGYVDEFATEPDLERFGWETRVALEDLVSYDRFKACAKDGE